MIDILKLVYGAVATKDIVPVLTHFCLYKGRIQASNGSVYIDAPFDHDVAECVVPAARFLKAVEACDGQPVFGMTEGGKLSVKKGKFKAYLPTLPVLDFPVMGLTGTKVPVAANFLDAVAKLKPFISEDASRIWSISLLLRDGYMYATNNIILVRTAYDWTQRPIAMPVQAVDRILEVGINPSECYLGETYVTFVYDKVWLRSQLVAEHWPNVQDMFGNLDATEPVPPDLKEAVDKIRHFCVNEKFPVIRFTEEGIQTDTGETGATYDGVKLPPGGYHADQLAKVLSMATHVNFSAYPQPCAIKGDGIEGLFVGIKS